MRLTPSVALGMTAVFVLAGCFGAGAGSEHYTLNASKDCFAGRGDGVVWYTDDSETKASGGWLRINYGNGSAFIGFTRDESEAARLKSKLVGDVPLPYPVSTEVATRGNAVYTSSRPTMPRDMKENIEACLK
jgi:hypothetical protein